MFNPNYFTKDTKSGRLKMESLLNSLKHKGVILSQQVYNAMLEVDRGDFSNSSSCYDDWQDYI